ncbi:hypothetical protein [Caenispirillum salinarum]|uniref:hypothetical protein n=1 Tax=Caenispirillum salinarum TaxID=859058 RepID=UPI0012673506|nr:hypothetical protein [Caenispirillum salinarum]
MAALSHRAGGGVVSHHLMMIVRRGVTGSRLDSAMLVRPRRRHATENGRAEQKGEEQAMDHTGVPKPARRPWRQSAWAISLSNTRAPPVRQWE